MKKLLTLLFIVISLASFAQPTRDYPLLGDPKSTTFAKGWLKTDSGLLNALKDTLLAPVRVGEQRFRVADSTLYVAVSTTASRKWVGWATSNGGSIGWFDVTNYGAIPNDTLSDQTAIQAAINACKAAGGGTVFFPNGRYLLKDTVKQYGLGGTYINAQLYIPRSLTTDSAISIALVGETSPNWEHSVLVGWPINQGGVILESTIWATTAGRPAILGTEAGSTAFGNWNMTDVAITNINFRARTKTNAGVDTANHMTGINFEEQSIATIENVRVDISSEFVNSSFMGFQGNYGIYMPKNGNAAWNVLRNVLVGGYETGIWFGEHTTADNITVAACWYGLRSAGQDHSCRFGRVLFNGCATNYFIEGKSWVTFTEFNTEHFDNGTGFGTKWYAFTQDIYHTADTPRIDITYHAIKSGVSGINQPFVITSTGGIRDSINVRAIGQPYGGSSYTLPMASTTTLGGVKIDGTTITINGSGVISSAGGTPSLTNTYVGFGNGSNQLTGSSNFTWNGSQLKLYSSSLGADIALKHPSNTNPFHIYQGYDEVQDFVITDHVTKRFKINSSGAVVIPNLGDGSTTRMVTAASDGLLGAQVIPIGATTNQSIALGNGAGQLTANDNNFQWNGSRLKLYSGSLGSTIEMRHASNTNSWKMIQGFSVVDDWVVTHGASDTRMIGISSSGVVDVPQLGTTGDRLVGRNSSSQLYDTGIDPSTVVTQLSGSATLDFGSTAPQSSTDLTITVTGAALGDVVAIGVPNGSVLSNSCYTAWVSSSGVVTVRFNNYDLSTTKDPASGTFSVKILR